MGLHYSSVLKANGFVASMGWLIVHGIAFLIWS